MATYHDLRDFIAQLAQIGQLKRIQAEVSPYLEMTEISHRVLLQQGPALLFERPKGHTAPVLTNLFGTVARVALALGQTTPSGLREIGKLLAFLKEPEPPHGFKGLWEQLPLVKKVMAMSPKRISSPPCQTHCIEGKAVDLTQLPLQTCWPEDAAPLLTWGLVITKGPQQTRQNLGIYRQQLLGRNKLIMRWLAHRGGALDFQAWQQAYPGQHFPVAVALGADPATLLAAVTPVPDTLSEYAFAGLLRGSKTAVADGLGVPLQVPAHAEYILEGHIDPQETALEGPFGDHTGYYNEIERFPVFTVERITHRTDPIYHSTYTGRPPDEPAILGAALNEVFIPLLQKQLPEIVDFYLPPEGCSYRFAIATIKKQYPGQAKRVMMGIWSLLKQFLYTKMIIVTDADINARSWPDVIWALTTRVDPARDCVIIENTPIDYLDFASPVAGLGSKIGFDATHKWPGETSRPWGKTITMSANITKRVDELWETLGI